MLGQKQAEITTDRKRYTRNQTALIQVRFPNPALAPQEGPSVDQLSLSSPPTLSRAGAKGGPGRAAHSRAADERINWKASIPFFLIHEFYPDNHGFNPKGITHMPWQLDAEGYIGLPSGPGLGVTVDEKLLEAESRKPQTYRWPGARLRDGSVSDY